MKVLGIMGSPRRHSNTEILLDSALAGVKEMGVEVEKVAVSELKIHPCMDDNFPCFEPTPGPASYLA
ncbi:unnamed protein product [marine sediment metagenome]|uniref:NADPH-dependent FMN reductase-like domain-containing protein n=1 Tax=marine sediment metagenome TaxID=412755 RepID=X1KQ20_9ZZZZ